MKSHKRSQSPKKPSFPKATPKEPSTGNEGRFAVLEIQQGEQIPVLVLTMDGQPLPFPVKQVQEGAHLRFRALLPPGYIKESKHDLSYWKSINRKLFPKTLKAFEMKESHATLLQIFALEVATITKSSESVLDSMPTKLFKPMQKAIRKVNPLSRMDKLDHLLLRNYRQKKWDLMKMADVGKLCGNLLKRDSFPASTIKDRTTELHLQTKRKPGAQNKV